MQLLLPWYLAYVSKYPTEYYFLRIVLKTLVKLCSKCMSRTSCHLLGVMDFMNFMAI